MRIRWSFIERAIPSLARLVVAVQERRVSARDILRTWNIFDENGVNVTEALRELGKAVRTTYVIGYAINEKLRQEVRDLCNRMETWNSFQSALYWGNGGRMRTNDPRRRDVNALCMQLLMNSVIFYNVVKYGEKLRRIDGSSPVTWEHVRMLGDYRITLGRRTVEKTGEK
jgi:TnpA family transposase